MNQEYITATVRHVLSAVGGFLIAQGVASNATVESISGGIVAAVGLVWSLTHKQAIISDAPTKKP